MFYGLLAALMVSEPDVSFEGLGKGVLNVKFSAFSRAIN